MINQQTIQHLRQLKLFGMASAFSQQIEQPNISELTFEERVALLVDREMTVRDNRKLQRLLTAAKLKHQAYVEDTDFQAKRGLNKSNFLSLIKCDWIRTHQDLHITGPTGIGKSWIACAFGQTACRQGLSVRYERSSRLLDHLLAARGDGTYSKLLRQLAKFDLLIIDDFGLKPLSQNQRHDLLEIIEDRHGIHSTVITSQLPVASWYQYLNDNDPTVADAILDRLLANAHRLELKGDSLRKKATNID